MLAEQQQDTERAFPPESGRVASPTIHEWSVVGYDRIVGLVRTEEDDRGKAIITSPVLRASFLGDARTPIVLTQSGSLYSLGAPAGSFTPERALDFLQYKSGGAQASAEARPVPRLPTSLMKIGG